MNLEDKAVTLSNGKKYMVIDTLDFEGKTYAYLSECENPIDSMFVEVINQNGLSFRQIEQSFLQEKLLPLFMEKFSKYQTE